ncbi:HAD family hydrolase [Cytobacillus gottheilii]|uniref:HAD family hydrolase n=1 Tax=Cytobacillus gottheilii TaxID=859144 RepID=UPI00082BFACB|nr:HAD family hydrolase [Cytobacillus gottheilii]
MIEKVYIFDLDDTLFEEHSYVRSGFFAVASEISKQHPVSEEKIYDLLVETWLKLGRGRVFNIVCAKLKIDLDIQKLVYLYRNHKPQIKLYEDAETVITQLSRNYKLGLITDGNSQMQWSKIKALNLEERFDCIVVTGDLGRDFWKPHELPYKKVVESLNMSYDQCVYIGDNPNKDFITASKLGMGTVRIIRDVGDHMKLTLSKEYEADRNIYSLLELIDK